MSFVLMILAVAAAAAALLVTSGTAFAAASAAGSRANAEWGFITTDTGVVTLAATSVGFLQGDVVLTVPREYAFLKLDQDPVDLAAVCIHKEMMVTFEMGEMLLANHQYAWDNDAEAGGVLTLDDDMGAVVALLLNTLPPGQDGSDTRIISMPTALGISEGTYTVAQAAIQRLGAQFKAIANSSALLGTLTDTYA